MHQDRDLKRVAASPESVSARRALSRPSLSGNLSAQFVLDMGQDDLVEILLCDKTQVLRPPRLEARRPSFDDRPDRLVGLFADPFHHLGAGYALERFDLLAYGDGDARHGEVAARPERVTVDLRRVDQEIHR